MKLPLPLPVLATIGAGVGWFVGRQYSGAGVTPPETATPAGASQAGGSAGDALAPIGSASIDFGDGGSGPGVLNGIRPGGNAGATPVGSYDETDGGYYDPPQFPIIVTPPAYTTPPTSTTAPVASSPPPPAPAPAPVASTWPAGATGHVSVKAGTYRMYTVVSGKITGYANFNTGGFSAYTCCHATYPWPSANSQRILVKLISGSRSGGFFSPAQAGVTYTAK